MSEDVFDSVVGGYSLMAPVGKGAMGDVYLARSVHPGRESDVVAIKLMKAAMNETMMRHAMGEAFLLSLLDHPNVIRTYEAGNHAGALYVVMEYNDGPDLDDLRIFLNKRGLRFPEPVVIDIIDQLLAALVYVHEAVNSDRQPLALVHRDICPGNVFIDSRGRVRLADFGVSLHGDSDAAQKKTISGHLGFMSPEALTGAALDQRSDVFSLGCVMYTLLTGSAPFAQDDYHKCLAETQRGRSLNGVPMAAFLERMLATKPAKRFASAREAREALRANVKGARATLAGLARVCKPAKDAPPRASSDAQHRVSLVSSADEQTNIIFLVDADVEPIYATAAGVMQKPPNRPVVFDMAGLDGLTPDAVNDARFSRLALLINELTQAALDKASAIQCQYVSIAPHSAKAFSAAMIASEDRSSLVHAVAGRRILLLGLSAALAATVTQVFTRLKVSVDEAPRDRSYHLIVHSDDALDAARAVATQPGYSEPALIGCGEVDAMDLCETIETVLGANTRRAFLRYTVAHEVAYIYRGIGGSGVLKDASRLGGLLECDQVLHVGDQIRMMCGEFSVTAVVAQLNINGARRVLIGLDLSLMSLREEAAWLRFLSRVWG